MRLKVIKFALLFVAIFLSCGYAGIFPLSSSTSQLQARLARARAASYPACNSTMPATTDCADSFGIIWSACAWNICGFEEDCRKESQKWIAAGSCGEPEWPACK